MKPAPHSCWRLFTAFFKIGLFTFGGGYAMIPLIRREVIDRRGWVADDHFLELLALAQSAPGPIALNTSVFVGYKVAGTRGALASVLGVVLPSFTVILLIAVFFSTIREHPVVDAALRGMRPAVVALIAAPLVGFVRGMGAAKIVLAVVCALIMWWFGVSPVWFVLAGIAGGIGWSVWRNRKRMQP